VIAALQRRFGELISGRLDAINDRSLTVDEIAKPVEEVGREADFRLEERLIEEQSPPAENCATCPCCGERARHKETRHTRLLTTHGARSVPRPYYHCRRLRHGFSPMDAILELAEGRNATRRVRSWMAKDGAQEESFAGAPPILMELPGSPLRVLVESESTVERTTIEVGAWRRWWRGGEGVDVDRVGETRVAGGDREAERAAGCRGTGRVRLARARGFTGVTLEVECRRSAGRCRLTGSGLRAEAIRRTRP
jgi:hypothetical protein